MDETSPPLPFISGKGGAESEKVRLVLLLFMNIFLLVVFHGSRQTELVSNNSVNEIPALAVAHNRTFLD